MNKYKNKKIEIDGFVFDSKAEAQRWQQLKLLERVGQIGNLRRQVKYVLIPAQKIDGKPLKENVPIMQIFVTSATANLSPKM